MELELEGTFPHPRAVAHQLRTQWLCGWHNLYLGNLTSPFAMQFSVSTFSEVMALFHSGAIAIQSLDQSTCQVVLGRGYASIHDHSLGTNNATVRNDMSAGARHTTFFF
jgi:hypothetical protein